MRLRMRPERRPDSEWLWFAVPGNQSLPAVLRAVFSRLAHGKRGQAPGLLRPVRRESGARGPGASPLFPSLCATRSKTALNKRSRLEPENRVSPGTAQPFRSKGQTLVLWKTLGSMAGRPKSRLWSICLSVSRSPTYEVAGGGGPPGGGGGGGGGCGGGGRR